MELSGDRRETTIIKNQYMAYIRNDKCCQGEKSKVRVALLDGESEVGFMQK